LGLTINRGGQARIRVAGRDVASVATLAEWLPVQVLDPDLHRLVEEGPSVRRRYLDWGVFHVEHRFLDIWRRYHRSLRQRNALLKRKQPRELDAWDERLSAEGEALDKCRRSYLADVVTDINRFAETLLGARLDLQYVSGWSAKDNFGAALIAARDRDVRFGSTTVGPHRADIRIEMADKKARGRVSRGQQKLLASSLVLGQLRHLERTRDIQSVLLLDDAAAELDRQGLDRLMSAASTLAGQLFVTALEREHLAHTESFAVFHVERGNVSSVV
jgi:DNA replication and repair protein RecF